MSCQPHPTPALRRPRIARTWRSAASDAKYQAHGFCELSDPGSRLTESQVAGRLVMDMTEMLIFYRKLGFDLSGITPITATHVGGGCTLTG